MRRFPQAALLLVLLAVGSCAPAGPETVEPVSPEPDAGPIPGPAEQVPTEPEPAPGDAARDSFPGLDTLALPPDDPLWTIEGDDADDELSWAERTLLGMTLRDAVAQMVMPVILGDFDAVGTSGEVRANRLVAQGVGGFIVSVGTPVDVAVKLNRLQRRARTPLLVGADLEAGAGFRLSGAVNLFSGVELGGATTFPPLMALGAANEPYLAYEMGRITAVESRAVGVHMPFAPVLDVNNNPANPIINIRSFGGDPERVALLGEAFVRGVQDHGAIATGKHFPGHGDTGVDSHSRLPLIEMDRPRLERVELRPFREAVDAGMGAIMTAHIAVPALTEDNGLPATLSPRVMTDLLRRDMGFDGLLVTDAMDMGAVDRGFDRDSAAVLAVEAGADVLLMPPDPERAIDAVVAAVEEGRISRERIEDAVLRILRLKESLGLDTLRTVEPEEVAERVGIPDHFEVAERIAERSLVLLRNRGDLLPLAGTRSARVLSVTYRPEREIFAGRSFDATLRATYPRLSGVDLDRDDGPEVYRAVRTAARASDLVVVSIHTSHAGRINLSDEFLSFVRSLQVADIPHVVVSFGNPYLISDFPDVQAYLLAWSGTFWSQRAAARALVGEVAIRGRSPIRIPPSFRIGDGIFLPVEAGP